MADLNKGVIPATLYGWNIAKTGIQVNHEIRAIASNFHIFKNQTVKEHIRVSCDCPDHEIHR